MWGTIPPHGFMHAICGTKRVTVFRSRSFRRKSFRSGQTYTTSTPLYRYVSSNRHRFSSPPARPQLSAFPCFMARLLYVRRFERLLHRIQSLPTEEMFDDTVISSRFTVFGLPSPITLTGQTPPGLTIQPPAACSSDSGSASSRSTLPRRRKTTGIF